MYENLVDAPASHPRIAAVPRYRDRHQKARPSAAKADSAASASRQSCASKYRVITSGTGTDDDGYSDTA